MLLSTLFFYFGLVVNLENTITSPSLSTEIAKDWTVIKMWEKKDSHYIFEATSSAFQEKCKENPTHYLYFPPIDQGAYEILLNNQLVLTQGDSNFNTVHSFYGAPKVSCALIKEAQTITWRTYAYAKFFTFFRDSPKLVDLNFYKNVFAESVPLAASAVLIIFGLFTFVLFKGKASLAEVLSLSLANFLLGTYFLLTVSGLVGIHLSMLTTARLTESLLCIGMGLFLNGLRLNKLPGTSYLKVLFVLLAVCVLVILSSDNGDLIQMGSVVGMLGFISSSLVILFGLVKRMYQEKFSRIAVLDTLSLGVLILLSLNDVLVATAQMSGVYLLPFGTMGALFFYTLSMNEKINITYRERDYLRTNLEAEVKRKTIEIQSKNTELEHAIFKIKEAQAELVQSARLVSLGTLAAGIAHEINNALNYVNASIRPVEKFIEEIPDAEKKGKALKLTRLMAEGLKLTFEIIASLRNYTGLNQAKLDEVNIHEVVESVLVLIKSKLTESYSVKINIPNNLYITASIVGLNQVFMNLITNALAAMPKGGTINISAKTVEQITEIEVTDSGTGMKEEILTRIFEPFFTTKEVGSGTGLGLYIVKREIERQGGTIQVRSILNQGTTFHLTFPTSIILDERQAA